MFRIFLFVFCILLFGQDALAYEAQTLIHDGRERSYLIEKPAAQQSVKRPLVILLHGARQTNKKAWGQTSLPQLAKQEGFILVAPNAIGDFWTDFRFGGNAPTGQPDDVGFLSALIDHLVNAENADKNHVYVTGISNGGGMTLRLGCELSGKLAAIAPVAANLPENAQQLCQPQTKLSVLMISGTEDKLAPYAGGGASHASQEWEGGRLSIPQTAQFWAANNGCASGAQKENLPDRTAEDSSTVQITRYTGCQQNKDVLLYTVVGGGHTWPTYEPKRIGQKLVKKLFGNTNEDVDSGQAIWAFFKQH